MLPSEHSHPTERQQDSRLSKLMKAKQGGNIPNACPFGCQPHQLNEQGYCWHLVGFTNGGREYEPLVLNHMGRLQCDGKKRQELQPGDRLIRITTSARVYRPTGNPLLAREFEREKTENPAATEEERLRRLIADVQNPILEGVVSAGTVNSVRPAFVGEVADDVDSYGNVLPPESDDEDDDTQDGDSSEIAATEEPDQTNKRRRR